MPALDLLATLKRRETRPPALAAGAPPWNQNCRDDSWRDIFSKILAAKIEPQLGHGRPHRS